MQVLFASGFSSEGLEIRFIIDSQTGSNPAGKSTRKLEEVVRVDVIGRSSDSLYTLLLEYKRIY